MFKVKTVSDEGFLLINTETGESLIISRNEENIDEEVFKAIVDFVRIQHDTYYLYERGTSFAVILQELSEAILAVSNGDKEFRISGLSIYDPKGKDLASLHADALKFSFREFANKEEYIAKKLGAEKMLENEVIELEPGFDFGLTFDSLKS